MTTRVTTSIPTSCFRLYRQRPEEGSVRPRTTGPPLSASQQVLRRLSQPSADPLGPSADPLGPSRAPRRALQGHIEAKVAHNQYP